MDTEVKESSVNTESVNTESKVVILEDTFYITREAMAKEPKEFDKSDSDRQIKLTDGKSWVSLAKDQANYDDPDRYVFKFKWAYPDSLDADAVEECDKWLTDHFGTPTKFYDLAINPQGVKLSCNNLARANRRPDGPGRGVGAKVNRVTLKLSNDLLDGKVGGDEEYQMFLKLRGEARTKWLVEYAKTLNLL